MDDVDVVEISEGEFEVESQEDIVVKSTVTTKPKQRASDTSRTRYRHGGVFTETEIVILVVVAMFGLVAVIGAYWYASTAPMVLPGKGTTITHSSPWLEAPMQREQK